MIKNGSFLQKSNQRVGKGVLNDSFCHNFVSDSMADIIKVSYIETFIRGK